MHYENLKGDVKIDNQWQEVSKESDPALLHLLINENTGESDTEIKTDNDEIIEGNDSLKEKQKIWMEDLPFVEYFALSENHFNTERIVGITSSISLS